MSRPSPRKMSWPKSLRSWSRVLLLPKILRLSSLSRASKISRRKLFAMRFFINGANLDRSFSPSSYVPSVLLYSRSSSCDPYQRQLTNLGVGIRPVRTVLTYHFHLPSISGREIPSLTMTLVEELDSQILMRRPTSGWWA